ncbi:mitochondrial matrix Mmp37 [Geopyxis carbonaria]|nr:mitochondrial matrix Mmp37 [Geopyxis carbonaria]
MNTFLVTAHIPYPTNDCCAHDVDLSERALVSRQHATKPCTHVDKNTMEQLKSLLWQFKAPIRYAVAYGSGVFSQGSAAAPRPMIDLIFGVTYTQHWHSLNMQQHSSHYSIIRQLGSGVVSNVQDKFGAGVYYNTYVDINGILVKYGVVNIDTLCSDLTDWNTLYLAGRLHKPVKILREDPQVKLSNDINLLSATRVALLLLPERFSEKALYYTIAGISYLGDPRMKLFTENPNKVSNIVNNQIQSFRQLYSPSIDKLPNVDYVSENITCNDGASDTMLMQDMDPIRRGNMVRRLPKHFRDRLYFQYQRKFSIPPSEFKTMVGLSDDEERIKKKEGGEFEQRIAGDIENLPHEVGNVIKNTIAWPSTTQSIKGLATAGPLKSIRYLGEKVDKWRKSKKSFGIEG